MCEPEQHPPGGHVVEKRPLLGATPFRDEAAGRQRRENDGLGRKSPPDLSHHHRDLDLSAGVLVEAEPEDPDLGQLVPHLAAPAQFGVGDLVAALLVVAARQQIAGGVTQQSLFVGQLEIHGEPHNPRMVDEMMLRCTSLLPP